MTFRSVSPLLRISILCGGLLAGWSAQATVVSPSGLGFLDLGKTTVDQTTGLEWLDLTETRGRSLQDVMTDLTDAGGQFKTQDRWRVATKLDFRSLMSNWFGLNYQGYHYDTKVSTAPLIRLLGDVADAELDAENFWADFADGSAGFASGILADEFNFWGVSTHRSLAIVVDYHVVYRKSRKFVEDYVDYIDDYGWGDLNNADARAGVYLYREYQPEPNTVAAPAPWLLGVFGLGLLCWYRRAQR
ncbi:hypothetical protein [Rheinheimera tilapiae]|uniref:PEP-CTERM sorting domain-containing protein n=1 Tax=Rheinheimera tilapiae TaxID=875043 RepID=A0ABV6B9H0_9GAMM